MKKTINVGIGGSSFIMDEDAYARLDAYLNKFRRGMSAAEAWEVMQDLEQRIAEIFQEQAHGASQVVNLAMVDAVIAQLGYPDESQDTQQTAYKASESDNQNNQSTSTMETDGNIRKRFFRDPDHIMIGGVCSGLAAYFNLDISLLRIIFLVAFFCGSFGFWIYIILWIAIPKASNAAEKCEMRGWAVTAENMRKFTNRR